MFRKLFFLLSFTSLFSTSLYTQGNWELLFPSPTSNQMVGMYFIDDQNGWSVGEYGTILKTTDGGENWTFQEIPWLFDLCDVHFPTALTGYAVGTDGFMVKTTDGGEFWDQLENQYVNNLNRILFSDENTGWAIGERGLILHTVNGGANWIQQPSNKSVNLLGIDFIGTESIIIVGGENTILTSHDDGQNWQMVSIDSIISHVFTLEDVYFVDELHGWICGGAQHAAFLKTFDGGQTWIQRRLYDFETTDFGSYGNTYARFMQQIYFYDDMKTGVGLFKLGSIDNIPMKTSNGGLSWSTVIWGNSENYNGRGRFCVLDDNRIIRTGYQGAFWFSTDKGKNWHLSTEDQCWWKDLTIGDNGLLLLHRFCTRWDFLGGNIVQSARSTDYGATWIDFEPMYLDSSGQTLSLDYFSDTGHAPGVFLNNRDTLWVPLSYRKPGETELKSSVFISTDFGYTYREVGKINGLLKEFLSPDTLICYWIEWSNTGPEFNFNYSFDCGATVNKFRSKELFNFFNASLTNWPVISAHYFFNGHKGFLVGTDGNIVKTEDTGQSWTNIYSGVVEDLHDITFIDEQTGFVVGDFGRILKTEDGGNRWRKTDSGTQEEVYSIGFINNHEGWVGTENGLRYTTDAGETWQGVPLRYAHGKYENLVFDKAGNGYAYTLPSSGSDDPGSYMQVLRMRSSTVEVNNRTSDKSVPGTIELYSNYPNPFNATTQIQYHLSQSGSVSLNIFNLQGQLVRTLVNELKESGRHTVTWAGCSDAGNAVSSGVYIYQLKSDSQVKHQKLLLLK